MTEIIIILCGTWSIVAIARTWLGARRRRRRDCPHALSQYAAAACYFANMKRARAMDSNQEDLDSWDKYSDGDPSSYGDGDMEDSLYPESDVESSRQDTNNSLTQPPSTAEPAPEDDGEQYTYFRCTGGSEWYSQAIDNEYGDYYYDTPMDDSNAAGHCTRCHGEDRRDGTRNGVNEWCEHFRICEETLYTTMTMDGWACCDCRTTSLSSLWTTQLESPVCCRPTSYNFLWTRRLKSFRSKGSLWTTQLESPVCCRPTSYNFLWTRRLKSFRSKGFIEYTPVCSNGLLLAMDTGHVPQCPKVNPFNRPNSDTFLTLQSLCIQTIAEARPRSVAVKDLDRIGPGTVIVTNRPLCQRQHRSSSLDCFEWTTSQDFHSNRNTNVYVFYFQPPHPVWIDKLPPSLSKRVLRYYVNRHLLLNVSIHVLYVLRFNWEELSPQQLYDDITNEPKSKFLHIYYCQHAHPEYTLHSSDGQFYCYQHMKEDIPTDPQNTTNLPT